MPNASGDKRHGLLDRVILFSLERKFAVFLLAGVAIFLGLITAPFDWDIPYLQRSPVPVDAIPDIGENQQIVFTEWSGRSPQDIEDQVTYPLTVSLLGVPGVKTVRSSSAFGFSSIYIVFDDDVDFYWSRSRILEKLNSLPDGALPDGVRPQLGPDATSLGQVFWYTLEGRDADGNPAGGWDLHELRTIQDWHVRYALLSTEGVAEVASVGGYVREYQVDVDPTLLRAYGVTLEEVVRAVRRANLDVGARTIEVNNVEYLVRGLGFIKDVEELRLAVIKTERNTPVFLRHVAHVSLGPAQRIGALDKNGAEAVGGVVTVRYGDNPLAVIQRLKKTIGEISPGLPQRRLDDGTVSRVTIVPFYDRTSLIQETLATLSHALTNEVLVTVLVVMVAVAHVGSSLVISAVLPMAVLLCFIAMRVFAVDANIVALSGIAIAVGVMVDVGIILTENILQHLERSPGESTLTVIHRAVSEVSGAVITSLLTTVVSFLPVFTLTAAEGKLFRPLAFTKTFTILAALAIALTVLPALAHVVLRRSGAPKPGRLGLYEVLVALGAVLVFTVHPLAGLAVAGFGLFKLAEHRLPASAWAGLDRLGGRRNVGIALAVAAVLGLVAWYWKPLGEARSLGANLLFCALAIGGWLLVFRGFQTAYPRILSWCLDNKKAFLTLPACLVLLGATIWLGFSGVFGWLPAFVRHSAPYQAAAQAFPGLSKEFMPALDEGSFLYMPSTMPHASIKEVLETVRLQDEAIQALPEVEFAVGKLGRAESPLDPAPVSMIETLITYRPEYLTAGDGTLPSFKYDADARGLALDAGGRPVPAADGAGYYVRGVYERDGQGRLVPDEDGSPFRVWRRALDPDLNPGREVWPGIRGPDDIWEAITQAAAVPGTTSASKLQPISARLVMLQSGIRSAMAVKVKGPDLEAIQKASDRVEALLREVRSIEPATVVADRIVAKPYLEIEIDRRAVAQYGLDLLAVQDVIETAIGGRRVTTTVEGRERYAVRVRYMRELRDDFQEMGQILVARPDGFEVPLGQLVDFTYTPGPMVIKTEDSFLVGYVLFDKARGFTEVDAVADAKNHLRDMYSAGMLELPEGVSYSFTGSYENHLRAQKRLSLILPLTLALVLLIIYLQFGRLSTTLLVFSGIALAWCGGFIMLWLYGQPWFMDVTVLGQNLRQLFQMGPVHLSLAVWVGFLALFGIATDDGVVMATYLKDSFGEQAPQTVADIRAATLQAGLRRIRPCMMTTATTILALLPVLTSHGKGADILVPMAIPSFGGMTFAVINVLAVPVLYCWLQERKLAAPTGGTSDETYIHTS